MVKALVPTPNNTNSTNSKTSGTSRSGNHDAGHQISPRNDERDRYGVHPFKEYRLYAGMDPGSPVVNKMLRWVGLEQKRTVMSTAG